jgi:hypothetical protein
MYAHLGRHCSSSWNVCNDDDDDEDDDVEIRCMTACKATCTWMPAGLCAITQVCIYMPVHFEHVMIYRLEGQIQAGYVCICACSGHCLH